MRIPMMSATRGERWVLIVMVMASCSLRRFWEVVQHVFHSESNQLRLSRFMVYCTTHHRRHHPWRIYPYSDTFRTCVPNTRIYGHIKERFPSALATAKPRFYVGKFGQCTKVSL